MEGEEIVEVVETVVLEAVLDGSKCCCWSLSASSPLRRDREDPLRFDGLFDSVALDEASSEGA